MRTTLIISTLIIVTITTVWAVAWSEWVALVAPFLVLLIIDPIDKVDRLWRVRKNIKRFRPQREKEFARALVLAKCGTCRVLPRWGNEEECVVESKILDHTDHEYQILHFNKWLSRQMG